MDTILRCLLGTPKHLYQNTQIRITVKEKIAMRVGVCTALMLLCMSIWITHPSNASNDMFLVAYSARITPDIDGIRSPGEWNDTNTHEYIRNNSTTQLKLSCALKHDSNWLYVWIKVAGDNDPNGFVIIHTSLRNQVYLMIYIVVLPNGTVKLCSLIRQGVVIDWNSSVDAVANATYSNITLTHLTEIKINKSYLNISNGYVLFDIGYCQRFSLGHGCEVRYYYSPSIWIGEYSGYNVVVTFSNDYFYGKDNPEDLSESGLWRIAITTVACGVLLGIEKFVRKRGKGLVG
jgi:hypothetical protein